MSLNNLKFGVDVTSACSLKPKDGQGSSSPYVELFLDGQRYRTTVKDKDLNPVWDESLYFSISDPSILQHLNLEACVCSTIRGGNWEHQIIAWEGNLMHSEVNPIHACKHHHDRSSDVSHQLTKFEVEGMRAEAPPPKIVRTSAAQPVDIALKETCPYLGGGTVVQGRILDPDKRASAYDLPIVDITGSLDPLSK